MKRRIKQLTHGLIRSLYTLSASALLVAVIATTSQAQTTIGERRGHVEFNGWSLDYDTFLNNDGLSLLNVKYNGTEILGRASFPVMSVYYQANQCGPYADRLNGPQASVDWAANATLVARSFTQNGVQWFELGIREFIGSYDIYQVWYIGANGQLDGHLFSRGLQCNTFHEHFPMWRLDFDIDGPANDRIVRETAAGQFATYTNEFEVGANAAYQHGWFVEDATSGYRVRVDFDDGTWNVGGSIEPETAYSNNLVGGMLARDTEISWPGSPSKNFPHDNNENIDGADLVMWYRGYLPHDTPDGAALWHSTGIRITASDRDTDGDGLLDSVDPDDDNDGIPDAQDALPKDPTESVDTDGDGIGNNADTDDDNDGTADNVDAFPLDASESQDTDGDGIGDNADSDADNDGIPDTLEIASASFALTTNQANIPQTGGSATQTINLASQNVVVGQTITLRNLTAFGDLNGADETFTLSVNDGQYETSPLQTGLQCTGAQQAVTSPVQANVRVIDIGNSVPGIRVTATTSGSVNDLTGCTGVNYQFEIQGLPLGTDTDGDGVANYRDLDSDNDGRYDVSEAGGTDADGDGIIDSAVSNQGSLTNPTNSDGDALPNFLDRESNNNQNNGGQYDLTGTRVASLDTNNDGQINSGDTLGGQDANNNGIDDAIENLLAGNDADGDGINDDLDPDDDNDGVNDDQDAFPLDATESVDTDGDGIGNNADTDDDNDGTPDTEDPAPLDPTIDGNSNTTCNLLSNGVFEGTVTGWFTNTTLTNSADAHSGNGALSFGNGWIGTVIEGAAGTVYTLSGYYKSNSASGWAGFGVDFVDANGVELGELVRTLEPANNWTPFSLDAQIPAGASFIRPWIYTEANRIVTLDDIDLRKAGCTAGNGDVNQAPFVSNPGSQVSNVGDTVSLNISATDPEGRAVSYAAAGLPAGLTINSSNGQISGTLVEEGSANVAISVSDGESVGMATFVWTVTQPGANAACNTLPNGGFENGIGGWSSSVTPSLSGDANSGNNALSFAAGWVSLTLPVTGATNYTLSGHYKTNSGTGWTGHGFDYLDSNGNEIGEEVRTLTQSNAYAQFSLASLAPAGAASIRLWFYAADDRSITLDDIDLRQTGCTGGVAGNSCNQLINPDFEISDGGWFTNTTPVLTSDAAQGNQAISVSNGWLSTAVAVQAGTSYTATAMVKTSGSAGFAGIGMNFVDSAGTQISDAVVTLDNATGFVPVSVTGLVPNGASGIQLWFYADANRTMIIDAVDLRVSGCQ